MGDKRHGCRCRVCGFGNHIEQKTVEFKEKLNAMQVCSWCGVVSAKSKCLSCMHMVCQECLEDATKAGVTSCWIDKEKFDLKDGGDQLQHALGKKIVHCTNADNGCAYTGSLRDLDSHLSKGCTSYLTECFECAERVPFKDLVSHFRTCEGVAGVLLRGTDGRSILDDIRNASKELEQALTSTSSDVRDAVGLFTKQLENLRGQLTVRSGGQADNEKSEYCNQ
ncbi:hypothetical protein HPB52_008523 [Rhipicephalus sanguineus]|uniref:Uncharacterized protein n=1 Tax=Rhipicephalus sanguineus TaxID=34632 RepID=A0A9D4QD34_RHISA|nr:hypothetical protein HPB52_008523 [Rhipicephalus sanguineus]